MVIIRSAEMIIKANIHWTISKSPFLSTTSRVNRSKTKQAATLSLRIPIKTKCKRLPQARNQSSMLRTTVLHHLVWAKAASLHLAMIQTNTTIPRAYIRTRQITAIRTETRHFINCMLSPRKRQALRNLRICLLTRSQAARHQRRTEQLNQVNQVRSNRSNEFTITDSLTAHQARSRWSQTLSNTSTTGRTPQEIWRTKWLLVSRKTTIQQRIRRELRTKNEQAADKSRIKAVHKLSQETAKQRHPLAVALFSKRTARKLLR